MVFSARGGGQNLKLCQVSELIVIWAEIGLVVAASDSAFVVVFFLFVESTLNLVSRFVASSSCRRSGL